MKRKRPYWRLVFLLTALALVAARLQAKPKTILIKGETLALEAQRQVQKKWDRANVDTTVEIIHTPYDLQIPHGKILWHVQLPQSVRYSRVTSVPVAIYRNGRAYKTTHVTLKVERFGEVAHLTQPVRRDERVNLSFVEFRRVPLTQNLASYIWEKEDLQNKRAKRRLMEGRAVLLKDIESIPLINQGDTVEVWRKSGPIQLSVKAVALSDGYAGDFIKVTNIDTGRSLLARINEKGVVELP